MSLYRVVVEAEGEAFICLVLAETERGARSIASKTITGHYGTKAHSVDASEVNPFVAGTVAFYRERAFDKVVGKSPRGRVTRELPYGQEVP